MLAAIFTLIPAISPVQDGWEAPFREPKLAGSVISATVTDLDGKVLFSRLGDLRVMPASNQKLLSNAFALWALGPGFTHTVRLWRDGRTVTVATDGAPLLSSDQLKQVRLEWGVADSVRIVERFAPQIPDGWEYDDLPNKYAAPVGAFLVDRGAFELWNEGGKPAFRPQAYGTKLRWKPTSGLFRASYDPLRKQLTASGTLPKETKRLDTLALSEPDLEAGLWLGNRVSRDGELPRRAPDKVLSGGTTAEIVAACLPPSDNQLAEQLLLSGSAGLAAKAGREPDAGQENVYRSARKHLTDFMVRTVGVSPTDLAIYDGSGLSRHNLVTTRAIAKLLVWSDKAFSTSVWHDAMALPGKGTLASRLKGIDFKGKTGSVDNVFALSGYVTTRTGSRRVVSVIVNHATASGAEVRGAIDAFVAKVAES